VQDKIINTACELFMQRGMRSVTMDEIAAHVGISKRTLYETFANKDDLLEKSLDYIRKKHQDEIRRILRKTPSCISAILNILKYETEQHNAKSRPNDIFYSDLKKCQPNLIEMHNEYRRLYMSFIAAHLEKGVEQGTVRKNLNLNLVATLLIAQIEGLHSMPSIREYHPIEIFTTMVLSFCRGISTESGLNEIEEFVKENNL
jgi:AcrR family transcriptional regulator